MSLDREARSLRLVESLEGRGLDRLLVTAPANVRYLTGFTGTNGVCLVGTEKLFFITDFRYQHQARSQIQAYELVPGERDLLGSVSDLAEREGTKSLGYDQSHLSLHQYRKLRDFLSDEVELIEAGGMVEDLRAVKDPGEIDAIRRAAALADDVFSSVVERGIVGHSEVDVSWALEKGMREGGSSAVSFPPIVAAAENGALPHAHARDAKIEPNTLVVIDWGAVVDGYCSDCTRTVATGRVSEEMASVYKVVKDAQEKAIEASCVDATAVSVDSSARDPIEEAGYGVQFGHGTGHGVGLEVHEQPRLARKSKATLMAGNVITVEPGIYIPDKFGVRIEDLVLVGDGGPECLTSIGRELTVVR